MRVTALFCLAGLLAAMPSLAAATLTLRVVNAAQAPIASVQLKAKGSTQWQADILRGTGLGLGRDTHSDITSSPCVYDVFVTFSNGTRKIIPGLNLCDNRLLKISGA